MLTVRLHGDGLNVEEVEAPAPRPGEALVRVHAAAITRGELEWPVDRLPAIPSYELSGVLVDSGDEVYGLTPFDRDGVAAEYALVPERVLAPKPARLIDFRNCLGMIASVSTLARSSGATIPVWTRKGCIVDVL